MIKALIIDDEPLARMVVKEYIQQFEQIEILQECNDGFEGLKAIQLVIQPRFFIALAYNYYVRFIFLHVQVNICTQQCHHHNN